MSEEETKAALWFLHHRVGVLMYLPEIPELRDLIIAVVQIVFQSVSNTIISTYRSGKAHRAATEYFEETGQFRMEDVKKALAGRERDGQYIPLVQLLILLKYLNIIAHLILEDSTSVYFMPCLLPHATADQLDETCEEVYFNPQNPCSLMIRFECGFVPTGVFPATIATLATESCFKLITKGIKKNRVQFHIGSDYDKVTLISRPKYYEVTIERRTNFRVPINQVCASV